MWTLCLGCRCDGYVEHAATGLSFVARRARWASPDTSHARAAAARTGIAQAARRMKAASRTARLAPRPQRAHRAPAYTPQPTWRPPGTAGLLAAGHQRVYGFESDPFLRLPDDVATGSIPIETERLGRECERTRAAAVEGGRAPLEPRLREPPDQSHE